MIIDYLVTVLVSASRGSFAEAARELNCSQSTVTHHVQAVEAAVGSELFDRHYRPLRLTSTGKKVCRAAEAAVIAIGSVVELNGPPDVVPRCGLVGESQPETGPDGGRGWGGQGPRESQPI